jgi:Lsr2
MAQRVNVILVDDIDGSEAAETVTFGLDGVQYEIDLSSENADRFRDVIAPYVGHARRSGGRRRSSGGSRSNGASSSSSRSGASAADIRAWARENGWDVPDRGRVSAEVREAYDAAH